MKYKMPQEGSSGAWKNGGGGGELKIGSRQQARAQNGPPGDVNGRGLNANEVPWGETGNKKPWETTVSAARAKPRHMPLEKKARGEKMVGGEAFGKGWKVCRTNPPEIRPNLVPVQSHGVAVGCGKRKHRGRQTRLVSGHFGGPDLPRSNRNDPPKMKGEKS